MSGQEASAEDQCLAELSVLADAKDAASLAMAEASIARFLVILEVPPADVVLALGRLQARFIQKGGASKMRADILDVIGARVEHLLDPGAPA